MSAGTNRILFVVEKAQVGKDLCHRFRNEGYEVDFATHAEQALALLGQHHFDVVVACIKIPGQTRIELRRRMRQQDPAAVIVLVTDCEAFGPASEALTGGAYDLLSTSFDPDELQRVVRLACKNIALRRENALLKERLVADRLAAVLAHEISDPLSSVVTNAKLLVRKLKSLVLTEDCREDLRSLETIAAEAGRCSDLVSNLLAFSRPRELQRSTVDIGQVIERSVMKLEMMLHQKGVSIKTDIDHDVPEVSIDVAQIDEAIAELISNACEALRGGGDIMISIRRQDNMVRVGVADNGLGMESEVNERACEPFFTTRDPGTRFGLGLAVVHGIVARHGGRIEISSKLGEGSVVALMIPIIEEAQ